MNNKDIFNTKKLYQNMLPVALFFILLELLRSVNISYLMGSHSSWMCITSGLMPLLGTVSGTLSIALFLLRTTRRIITAQAPTLLTSVYHIPSFCGALYFSRTYLGFIIPAVCALLFIAHPVGHHAWPYALLWLIPICANIFSKRSFYAQALTSTFVTHAVGSVLWIYRFNNLSVAQWIALIPRVLLERFFFASTICAGYIVLSGIMCLFKNRPWQKKATAQISAQ